MKTADIIVSIFEDHQGIIDGYLFRLKDEESLRVAGIARYGEDLEAMLMTNRADVLILDMEVPISPVNSRIYPLMAAIPRLKKKFPATKFLVISMHQELVLIDKLIDLGINGYIFKGDAESIQNLGKIIFALNCGGVYFSPGAYAKLNQPINKPSRSLLSARQHEALSLSIAYPNSTSAELASRMGVSSSTLRNLLSNAYERLGVHTHRAAVAHLQMLEQNEANTQEVDAAKP